MVAGVLLKIGPGQVRSVLEAVRKIPGVKYAYAVFGRYDLVAMVEGESIEDITKIIVEGIGSIDGVVNTETLIKAAI